MSLIKITSPKTDKDVLDEVTQNVIEEARAKPVGSKTWEKQGMPIFHKGFYIQSFSFDGIHWIGWAKNQLRTIEFEAKGLSDHDCGKQLVKLIDIYTKNIN